MRYDCLVLSPARQRREIEEGVGAGPLTYLQMLPVAWGAIVLDRWRGGPGAR